MNQRELYGLLLADNDRTIQESVQRLPFRVWDPNPEAIRAQITRYLSQFQDPLYSPTLMGVHLDAAARNFLAATEADRVRANLIELAEADMRLRPYVKRMSAPQALSGAEREELNRLVGARVNAHYPQDIRRDVEYVRLIGDFHVLMAAAGQGLKQDELLALMQQWNIERRLQALGIQVPYTLSEPRLKEVHELLVLKRMALLAPGSALKPNRVMAGALIDQIYEELIAGSPEKAVALVDLVDGIYRGQELDLLRLRGLLQNRQNTDALLELELLRDRIASRFSREPLRCHRHRSHH